jgi:adenine-specific DNA-methyltransferase
MFIRASVDPGGFVVDPFGGSGSLARAARNVGWCNALCIELDENNYNIAKKAYDESPDSLFA